MSGWSASEDCPECGAENSLETWGENRPFDSVGGICLECGFSYKTVEEQLTLEDVNEERSKLDLKPLTELRPKLQGG